MVRYQTDTDKEGGILRDDFLSMKYYFWIFVLAGAWLIVAPFVVGYSHIPSALWNSMLVGVLIEVIAFLGYVHEEE